MTALVALAVFIVLVEVAAIRGWGVDSRDGRDWTAAGSARGGHGARNQPRAWWRAAAHR